MCCFFCAGGATSTSSRMLHNSNMHILALYCLFSHRSRAVFSFFFVCSSGTISCGWNHTCSVSRFLPDRSVTSPHVPSRTIDASEPLPLFFSVFSCLSFGVLPSSPTVIIACLFVCSPAAGPHGEATQINSLPWQAARLLYIPPVRRSRD